jgi:hypothetical protein
MNCNLQSRFERVEIALNTLLDSISSYNPSTQAAVALVEADDDLSKGLEQRKLPQQVHLSMLSTCSGETPAKL